MIGRLLRRADFLRVASSKRKWVAPGLILQIAPPPERTEAASPSSRSLPTQATRVGFTASRKVGNAVERNRAKRRLREVVRTVFSSGKVSPCDLVLIARRESLTRDFDLLIEDFKKGLQRWKLINIPNAASEQD